MVKRLALVAIVIAAMAQSAQAASKYFQLKNVHSGLSLKIYYNSAFACGDWLGYCIPNSGYPLELPYGACGQYGEGDGPDGLVGSGCGSSTHAFGAYDWEYFEYDPHQGQYCNNGVCTLVIWGDVPPTPHGGFADQTSCVAALVAARTAHPGTDYSTNCLLHGNTGE